MEVRVSSRFKRSFKTIPIHIQQDFELKIVLFMKNPRDQKLVTHKLKGKLQECLAFDLRDGFRVLFEFIDRNIVSLLDIGSHDKYHQWKK